MTNATQRCNDGQPSPYLFPSNQNGSVIPIPRSSARS